MTRLGFFFSFTCGLRDWYFTKQITPEENWMVILALMLKCIMEHFPLKYALTHNAYKNMLLIVVECDSKDPFSVATTLKCGGGSYSISWNSPPYS